MKYDPITQIHVRGGVVYQPQSSNITSYNIGRDAKIHSHVWIGEGVVIGERVKIQAFAYLPNGVVVGDDVFIGPRVTFCNDDFKGNYPLTTFVANGVRIGAAATILPGITLGKGCIIGAGAVVTKNIPPGETWIGNPAKPL